MSFMPKGPSESLADAIGNAADIEFNTQRALSGESGVTTWQQEVKNRLARKLNGPVRSR